MRKLEERLSLTYMDQVEFIRFRNEALDADNEIKRFNIYIERLRQKKDEAMAEMERLFLKKKSEKP